jgi:hypothetical protein
LKQRRIEEIILAEMMANTCIGATARGGAELGYHVILVRDATAVFTPEAMHSAHQLNGPLRMLFCRLMSCLPSWLKRELGAQKSSYRTDPSGWRIPHDLPGRALAFAQYANSDR